jgi:hypothetical protein
VVGDRLPPRLLDRRPRSFRIVQEHAGGQPQRIAVAVTVQLDPVPGGDDLGDQRRATLDLLADEEEGRSGAGLAEDLEHDRRALRMRTVVEAERDPVDPVLALHDPQPRPQARYQRSESRRGMHRGTGGNPGARQPADQGPSGAAALCAAAG